MKIKRDIYLNKLIRKRHNGLIKVITGIRRCGKTYLLFNLFYQYLLDNGVKEDHIIKVSFDNYKYIELRNPKSMYEYVEKQIVDKDYYYIILDEVQNLDSFVDVLNGFIHIDNADVYVTGSNSKFLSRDVITEFRGRGDEIHVLPLSFSEFTSAYKNNISEAWDDYINYGGLPLVLSFELSEEKEEYLFSLFKELYFTDIMERHNIRNIEEFNEILDFLSSSVGSLTNSSKLVKTFKSVKNKTISDLTITKYMDYMQDAFLINKVSRYDIKGKKYIGSPVKYYFEDIGLRNARINFRQTEENHIMENIIYNELRYRGYRVDVGVVEVYGRDTQSKKTTKTTYEVDFVASKGNQKFYIQSAFAIPTPEKKEQEEKSLNNIHDSFTKIIVVKDDKKPRRDENGIITIGIKQFLLDQTILN
ncbi:MAG: ATP-binding protein [Sphaerochaetaceae bacterium]|nr:ATP-binding protein [Sphaerochaetaceae bacterium]MCF0262486.1 ATP-binding protein [Sphaerochaetaceae bacterium]